MGARIEIVDRITKYRILTDELCPHLTKKVIIAQLEDCAGELTVEQAKKREKDWLIVIALTHTRQERVFTCVNQKLQALGLIKEPLKFPK